MNRKPASSPVLCEPVVETMAPSSAEVATPEIAPRFALSVSGVVWGEPEWFGGADPCWAPGSSDAEQKNDVK